MTTPRKPQPKRKPGRPKKSERPIGPAEILEIERGWLTNVPLTTMAETYGVDVTTIRDHVERHIRPKWVAQMNKGAEEDIAKVNYLEDISWPGAKEGDPSALAQIRWCIEHRAKCAGHYAAQRMHLEGGVDFRVAGVDPAQLNAEALQRLAAGIEAQRKLMQGDDD